MKIIQVIPNLRMGGAENMCENLTYELIKKGHQVIIVSLYNVETPIVQRLKQNNVDLRFLNKKKGFDFKIIFQLKKIFKSEKPDAIHTHLYAIKYGVIAAILAGVKRRIHTFHSIATKETGKIDKKLNKFFYKFNNVVPVALSEVVQDTIKETYKIKRERIPIIYNGIDLGRCEIKETYKAHNPFIIVHVGSMYEPKNHRGLVEAFSIFHEKHKSSELWLIGDGQDRKAIEELVEIKGLANCVDFKGIQANVFPFLHAADIFTLPSLYEGIPLSLAEAMGTGLPVVVTKVGGMLDMVEDNVNGIMVDVDSKKIAEAFERYYLNNEFREHCGKNALLKSKDFSAEIMADKYIQLYGEKNVARK